MSEEVKQKLDLRKNITSVFAHLGQPNPEAWLATVTDAEMKDIEDAIEREDIGYQRFAINRVFRNGLGRATINKGIDTMSARWGLIDNDSIEAWIHHFTDLTAKCIIKNSLFGMVAPPDKFEIIK